jgi:hypothetical protein
VVSRPRDRRMCADRFAGRRTDSNSCPLCLPASQSRCSVRAEQPVTPKQGAEHRQGGFNARKALPVLDLSWHKKAPSTPAHRRAPQTQYPARTHRALSSRTDADAFLRTLAHARTHIRTHACARATHTDTRTHNHSRMRTRRWVQPADPSAPPPRRGH